MLNLESTLRKAAKPVVLFGAAAYLTLNMVACSGSAAPTVPPANTPPPTATATASPTPNKPEEQTPTPQQTYNPPTPPATATAVPPTQTPTPQPTATATATATSNPPTPMPTAIVVAGFTQEQLKQKLSGLDEIVRANEPTLDVNGNDNKGYAQKVQDIFEAGYYLTTGKTPQQNNIEVKILTRAGIDAYIEENRLSSYLKGFPAFTNTEVDLKTGQYREILVIRGGVVPRAVLNATAHEGGHALAFILNPKITGANLKSAAVAESQAYTFEAAFNRTLDELNGGTMLKYGQNAANTTYVSDEVQFLEDKIKAPLSLYTTHPVGEVLPWLRAREKGMLRLGQSLTAQQTYQLFLDLVTTPKDDADAEKFVDGLLVQANPGLGFIKEQALSRLVPNYSAEKERPTILRFAALLVP